MDAPSGTEVRMWGPPTLNWTTYGFPEADPDPLDIRVGWAVGTLYAVAGRTLDSITSDEETAIAQQVIAALTVLGVMGGGEAALAVLEAPWLKSFKAGSYSETRFSPSEIAGGGSKSPPYPSSLWLLLWSLMDEDHRDDWLVRLGGQRRPAGIFVEPDWSATAEVGPAIWGPGIETW